MMVNRLDSALRHLLLLPDMTASRTRIKICGFTRLDDAMAAAELGVDALGFVFVPKSKRYIAPEDALSIVDHLSPFVTIVGLFLNAKVAEVEHTLKLMPHLVPQFHGQESAEYCDGFGRPYLKAMGVGLGMPDREELQSFSRASGFLFDSNEPGELGGTGHAFDWTQLEAKMERPLILAGGLNVKNIGRAVDVVAPHAVDVSTGVESEKGIKNVLAMQQFVKAVHDADEKKNPLDIRTR